jgi:prolyl-tRNA synthetase
MVSYTHEEAVHSHAMSEIQSHKQMPLMVYHFQSKGRDEARPRAGLLRVREFVMKDAYSFDIDEAGLEKSYKAQHGAYERIFKRMGLDAISVESDTGAMGGDIAHEFQVLTEVGEDRVVVCPKCDYRANMERATRLGDTPIREDAAPPRSEIAMPSTTSIEALVSSLDVRADRLLKTLLLRDASGGVVASCCRATGTSTKPSSASCSARARSSSRTMPTSPPLARYRGISDRSVCACGP